MCRALTFAFLLPFSFLFGQGDIGDLEPFLGQTRTAKLHQLIPTLTGHSVLRPTDEDIVILKEASRRALQALSSGTFDAKPSERGGLICRKETH